MGLLVVLRAIFLGSARMRCRNGEGERSSCFHKYHILSSRSRPVIAEDLIGNESAILQDCPQAKLDWNCH